MVVWKGKDDGGVMGSPTENGLLVMGHGSASRMSGAPGSRSSQVQITPGRGIGYLGIGELVELFIRLRPRFRGTTPG